MQYASFAQKDSEKSISCAYEGGEMMYSSLQNQYLSPYIYPQLSYLPGELDCRKAIDSIKRGSNPKHEESIRVAEDCGFYADDSLFEETATLLTSKPSTTKLHCLSQPSSSADSSRESAATEETLQKSVNSSVGCLQGKRGANQIGNDSLCGDGFAIQKEQAAAEPAAATAKAEPPENSEFGIRHTPRLEGTRSAEAALSALAEKDEVAAKSSDFAAEQNKLQCQTAEASTENSANTPAVSISSQSSFHLHCSSTSSSSSSSSTSSSSLPSSSSSCLEESSSSAASISSDIPSKSTADSSEYVQSSSSGVLSSEPDSIDTFRFAIGGFSLLCSYGRISEAEAVLRSGVFPEAVVEAEWEAGEAQRTLWIRNFPAGTGERDVRQLFGEFGPLDYVAVNQKKRYAFVAFFTTEEAVCAKLTVEAALKEMKEMKGNKEKEGIGEGEEKEKEIEKGKQEIEKQCCMHIGYAKKNIPLYHHSNNSARKKKKMNKDKNEEKDEKEDNQNHPTNEEIFSLNQNKNAIFPAAPPENVDLEHVIEKMAMYVVVKGKGFETKMREEKKQFPLFSFLREGGEGNEYYKWRVFCALNGISEEESGKRVIRYAQGKRWDVPE
ncbi:putative Surp module [Monocercomonoides exilis]|uniref:putative Surp module n=1 Tax=Monocercomonoides exilis TaxID=2049356 RepID=UPI003559ECA0|nr:putative Surp module [Monocercomonoides exilis]